ncbi:MAG: AIR synthase related protein [Bacteroidota bacterium]
MSFDIQDRPRPNDCDRMSSNYDKRGVSADKSEVHAAIQGLDKGLFPNAFCKILPDLASGDPEWCNLMHADTAGTKTALAYLYWKETGDLSVWKGIVQDALVMNLDDMACVGVTDGILVSSTIGRNKHLVPGEVVSALIQGAQELVERWADWGIHVKMAGGETADVGDIVRTLDVGYTAFARIPRAEVIENAIQPGNVIVGLASFGQARYETAYNSGIGSNGLTNARHDVLNRYYAEEFPESYAHQTPREVIYMGPHRLTDELPGLPLNVGQMLLSPTRTYLPFVKALLASHRASIHGMIHNTGGGQTKCMKFVKGLRVIKDNLFDTPPVFNLIRQCSKANWREMYQVFNMGHRLEIYTDEATASALIALADNFGIEAQVIGRTEAQEQGKSLLIKAEDELEWAW